MGAWEVAGWAEAFAHQHPIFSAFQGQMLRSYIKFRIAVGKASYLPVWGDCGMIAPLKICCIWACFFDLRLVSGLFWCQ